MNHIYKVIFCKATGTFIAVAEFARANGKKGSGTVGSAAGGSQNNTASRYSLDLSGLTTLSAAIFLSLGLSTIASAAPVSCQEDSTVLRFNCGTGSNAYSNKATAIGINSTAGGNSTALGYAADASGPGNATTIRREAKATAGQATTLVSDSQALGSQSTALGMQSRAYTGDSMALGRGSQAGSSEANKTITERATSVDINSQARALESLALGANAIVSIEGATALGASANAAGKDSVSISRKSSTSLQAANAVVVGANANASLANTTILGSTASADGQAGDMAIGQGSTTAVINNSGAYRINSTQGGNTAAATAPTSVVSVGSAGMVT
ncbi:hypothetical protein KPY62_05540 [Psychrobacter sp. TAE2020]|uniref:ESPR-type extended signal peptide-containing protein n=1 Tax=Psychrobacter sp. TAE2020 TaxID=2846762 RepID=UPI001C0F6655|nr:ESPR-type extended signal peptide-containing protein [Psychrobacter sp. TAE2020]MBU5616570.1 hypothetical protein [Psychrobacter sp. TAE2020]